LIKIRNLIFRNIGQVFQGGDKIQFGRWGPNLLRFIAGQMRSNEGFIATPLIRSRREALPEEASGRGCHRVSNSWPHTS